MNLPFGNAGAIKHRREGVRRSWAARAQETGLGVRVPGGRGQGEPADDAQPLPPQPPPTPWRPAAPRVPTWDQACAAREARGRLLEALSCR